MFPLLQIKDLSVDFVTDYGSTSAIKNIFLEIKKGEIATEDLEKTKTNYLKANTDRKNFNRYSMDLVINYFRDNDNIDDPKNYTDIVKAMTSKDIQDFANSFLSNADTFEVVFKPLQ